ncbi:sialin [Octopus sinensis]|uniref:Sialin n=1 Tax=Octopus sinensis TaxID=2607531 RepID=A0A6P7TSH0_9MOLL|nr:sialin [Octopus sinensis]
MGFKSFRDKIQVRFILVGMAFLGFMVVYALRVNLSVAIIAMTNTLQSEDKNLTMHCPVLNDTKADNHTGEFDWDSNQQGLLLGSFFYGYICTQFIGAVLAKWKGAKYLLGGGIALTAVLSLVIPAAAQWGFTALVVIRVAQGFFEGVTFPAMHNLLGKWSPMRERSILATITYSGAHMGTVLSLPISGVLANSDLFGGWPSIFYVPGIGGIIWFIGWIFIASNSPAEHPWISEKEKRYIESSVGCRKEFRTPWYSIFTSIRVWAINVGHVTFNWNFYLMLTSLPLYMKTVLHFDMSQNSLYSAIPYLLLWFLMTITGFVADWLKNGILSTGTTRKILNTVGITLPAILLGTIQYVGCDRNAALAMVTMAIAFSAIALGGYQVNHLDIAPNFAGTLMGISNTFATIPGFVAPSVVGAFTHIQDPYFGWLKVFYLSVSINVIGAVFYLIFASGEEQSWAQSDEEQKEPIVTGN